MIRGPGPTSNPLSRRTLLRRSIGGAALLGLGPLLAACGSDGNAGAGRMRVAVPGGGASESLSPTTMRSHADIVRALALYDMLAADVAGKRTLWLAESVEPERGASVWVVRLRDGIRFHDGKAATSEDLLFSLRRIMDPGDPGDGAVALAGLDLKRSRKLDRRTVQLELERPLGDFGDALARGSIFLRRAGSDDRSAANGTGPFKIVSFRAGEATELARNPDYWGRGARGDALIDRLVLLSIDDATARLNALRGDQAELDFDIGYLNASQIESSDRDLRLLRAADAIADTAGCFSMNCAKPPFDDPRVRLAFKLAIDRQELVDKAFHGFGAVGNDLFGQGFEDYAGDLPQREHDPERARALLRRAGAGDLRVTLSTSAVVPGADEAAPLFAEQLRHIGVAVRLDEIPPDSYFADLKRLADAPLKAGGGTNQAIVAALQSSFTSGSPFNLTGWSDAAFDRLFAQARATSDEGRRRAILHELQHRLWQDGGLIVWGNVPTLHAVRDTVSDVRVSAFVAGYPDFTKAKVTAA